ncbi:MAG: hypothetical protein ACRDV9_00645 [Acidimicrobiia bacterium]
MGKRLTRRRALTIARRSGFAGAALFAACGGGGGLRLPTAAIQQFESACTSAGFSDEQCTCFVEELSKTGGSDAQFRDAEEAMEVGGKENLPPELEDARSACPPPAASTGPPNT